MDISSQWSAITLLLLLATVTRRAQALALSKVFGLTRGELLVQRTAFQKRREIRHERRQLLLDDNARVCLDKAFKASFIKTLGTSSTIDENVKELEQLMESGATTACFSNYELSKTNFALAMKKHFLLRTGHNNPEHSLCCLLIYIEAGDSFIHDRLYAGQGGHRALLELFQWTYVLSAQLLVIQFENPDEAKHVPEQLQLMDELLPLIIRLLQAMCIAAPADDSMFWQGMQDDFLYAVQERNNSFSLERRPRITFKRLYSFQLQVTYSIFSLSVFPLAISNTDGKEEYAERTMYNLLPQRCSYPFYHHIDSRGCNLNLDVWLQNGSVSSAALFVLTALSCPLFQELQLVPDLVELIEQREGPFASDSIEELPAKFQKHFIDLFLASRTERKQLQTILEDSPRITTWLINSNSNCLFRLISQRERRLISFFLHHHREQLQVMRDANGRDLLLHACTCRGRVERIIEMLVRSGFSLQTLDSNGDSALVLAKKYADTKTQNMVTLLIEGD